MTEQKFLNDKGSTTADDPSRMIWYGMCGYWTDNWDSIGKVGSGIPCCPECLCPGCQVESKEWDEGAAAFQAKGNPGYVAFLADQKEQCHDEDGLTMIQRYKAWLVLHSNGRVTNPRSGGD